ncbi:unnamed protein product [Rhizophagus irregularis]|nr:unnamed protein product [Rhizophagus irregularis]
MNADNKTLIRAILTSLDDFEPQSDYKPFCYDKSNDEIKVYNRQRFDRRVFGSYEWGFVQTSSPKVGIQSITGKFIIIDHVDFSETVDQLKTRIYNAGGELDPLDQRLIFAGKQLEDGRTLSCYGIVNDSTILLARRLRGGGPVGPIWKNITPTPYETVPPYETILPDSLLSPRFDFDLTNIKDDGLYFTRGGKIYNRPCG